MMKMKVEVALVVLVALLLVHTTSGSFSATSGRGSTSNASAPSPSPSSGSSLCDVKCGNRCGKAGIKDRCMKYCGICCEDCKGCVPSGTYGNKHECPCYRDKRSSKGTPKCP